MLDVRDAYQGNIVIPLPELDANEKAAVANLVSVGLNQSAERVSSTIPDLYYPPVKPGQTTSEKRATTRRLANLAWWQMNKMGLTLRKRSRHLLGYGISPVVIRPDFERRIPRWQVRDPLTTYIAGEELTPDEAMFSYTKPFAWLKAHYPVQARVINAGPEPHANEKLTIVEYHDADQQTMLVLGQDRDDYNPYQRGGSPLEVLENTPNRTGRCLVVQAGLISLDKRTSAFHGVLGMYYQRAKLQALAVIATEKGIFPDTYLVSRPNELAEFIEGPFDGRTGYVNRIKGGEVTQLPTNPGFMTNPMMDRLERDERVTAGVPAEYGGESTSNIRTGRRGESVLSAVVDFPVQEAQDILAESLYEENVRAVAVAKAFFDTPTSFYVNWKGARVDVDYTPSKDFETDNHSVRYAHAGTDINGLAIAGGQRVGMGTMSKLTFAEIDPLIEDPVREHKQVLAEALEQAGIQSIQAQVQNPNGPWDPHNLARLTELILTTDQPWFMAVQQVQKETQEAQAAQIPPGAPEAQPGLAGQAQVPPGTAIPPPAAGEQDLGMLLRSLSQPQRAGVAIAGQLGANQQGGLAPTQALR
jgi:hypothetical protein